MRKTTNTVRTETLVGYDGHTHHPSTREAGSDLHPKPTCVERDPISKPATTTKSAESIRQAQY